MLLPIGIHVLKVTKSINERNIFKKFENNDEIALYPLMLYRGWLTTREATIENTFFIIDDAKQIRIVISCCILVIILPGTCRCSIHTLLLILF